MNISKFLGEVAKEAKRVRWPKNDFLINAIFIILSITVLAALALTLQDLAIAELLGQIRSAFESLR
jgi:preprotein translocase SecE subunit